MNERGKQVQSARTRSSIEEKNNSVATDHDFLRVKTGSAGSGTRGPSHRIFSLMQRRAPCGLCYKALDHKILPHSQACQSRSHSKVHHPLPCSRRSFFSRSLSISLSLCLFLSPLSLSLFILSCLLYPSPLYLLCAFLSLFPALLSLSTSSSFSLSLCLKGFSHRVSVVTEADD